MMSALKVATVVNKMEVAAHGVSGGLSALFSSALLHPLETIRTRLQAADDRQELSKFILETYNREGLSGFYSGFSAQVSSNVFSYAVYFLLYRLCQRYFLINGRDVMGHFKVSIQASVIATILNTPLWVVSSRLMKDGKLTMRQCIRAVIKNEGVAGLWKGLAASLMLVINPVIQYVSYEWLKDLIMFPGEFPSILTFFILAAISKTLATLATYPILTIRTRQQLEKTSVNQLQVAMQILRSDGVFGFYRGFQTKLVQTVINTALIMGTHENLARMLTRWIATAEVRVLNEKSF